MSQQHLHIKRTTHSTTINPSNNCEFVASRTQSTKNKTSSKPKNTATQAITHCAIATLCDTVSFTDAKVIHAKLCCKQNFGIFETLGVVDSHVTWDFVSGWLL